MLQLSEVAEEDKSECMKASVGPMQNGSEGCNQKVNDAQDEKAESAVGEHQEEEEEERKEGG